MTFAADLPPFVGRYEIVRPLGQGGMGRVILAKDSVLGRYVALKLLRGDLGLPPEARSSLFDRMRQEARAAAALSHPNMVTLHDMGDAPDVGLYLVFEFIDGPTLRDRITEGPLPLSEVAHLARTLGDALTEAHQANVIHRDVKPENVLLSRSGPKITDFGIARLPDSNLTNTGVILGTPSYCSPESVGRSEFSAKSDQFGLAATLYEALTGHRAFDGTDTLSIVAQVANSFPVPSADLLPQGGALAPVDRVLWKALAKEPDGRFSSCREFGQALAAALEMADRGPFDTMAPSGRASLLTSIVPSATRRKHNIAAAVALLILVALVVFGRRRPASTDGVSFDRVRRDLAQLMPPPSALPSGKGKPRDPKGTSNGVRPMEKKAPPPRESNEAGTDVESEEPNEGSEPGARGAEVDGGP